MHALSTLLIGFSIFSALSIALTHFRCENYKGQVFAQVMGMMLLASLTGLQLIHFAYLQYDSELIHSAYYHALLIMVAPVFYLFSKPILQAYSDYRPVQLLHFLPVLAAPFLAHAVALPLSFALGAGYLLWLAWGIYALRDQRSRFRMELAILGMVFAIAVIVMLLGLSLPLLSETLFFTLYASAIGSAFLLVSVVLNLAPQLSTDVTEAARETYAITALGSVDCDAALEKLRQLLEHERLYQQAELDLPMLANKLELSTHQLSELINTRLGKGFSRYIREYRVGAAKEMLLSEPSASVLSVGLSVGFTSQSNFYDAFREVVGMTPGRFRKLRTQSPPE